MEVDYTLMKQHTFQSAILYSHTRPQCKCYKDGLHRHPNIKSLHLGSLLDKQIAVTWEHRLRSKDIIGTKDQNFKGQTNNSVRNRDASIYSKRCTTVCEVCEVVLTFESVDEILKCDHSNESY